MTGIFGRRYISNYFIVGGVWPNNFSIEITRDSNTLDTPKEWRERHSCTNCVFSYRHTRKFRCEPILLVYLENARGNSSRAFRNKVPRHCSSADENGFGLPLASNLQPLQFADTV
ncbi:MAG: hypothetical protein WBM06_12070, partial [Pseudolabrys sp.]